jgi:hypothetical protein
VGQLSVNQCINKEGTRLAAIIRSVEKYIFVNRSGMSRESMVITLQTKRLTILDDGMLFDLALEAVIVTLREQRIFTVFFPGY